MGNILRTSLRSSSRPTIVKDCKHLNWVTRWNHGSVRDPTPRKRLVKDAGKYGNKTLAASTHIYAPKCFSFGKIDSVGRKACKNLTSSFLSGDSARNERAQFGATDQRRVVLLSERSPRN
ncbi:hypothetical protein KCU64_g74, partial [Aureobasidium melanogenum]